MKQRYHKIPVLSSRASNIDILQPGEDDGAVVDDTEEIGELEFEDEPMDFEGIDEEASVSVGGGGGGGPAVVVMVWEKRQREREGGVREEVANNHLSLLRISLLLASISTSATVFRLEKHNIFILSRDS